MVFGRLANSGSEGAAAREESLKFEGATDFRAMRAGQVEFLIAAKAGYRPILQLLNSCNS
jgi:hypothetical protein